MDVIFDLIEALLEIYVEFFENVVPKKNIGKGTRVFLTLLCALVSLGILGCLIAGGFLIASGERVELIVGIVLVVLSSMAILAHIIIVLYNSKKNKKDPEPLDRENIISKLNK